MTLQGNLAYDHVEMLVWGRSWQLTYWKHPPLPAWVAEAVSLATSRAIWPQFFIAPATVAAAACVVWRAALDVVGPWRALAAALMLQGCIYYSYECDLLNHNSIQIPFVALTMWAGWRAVNGSVAGWVCFGLAGSVAIYGKHSAGLVGLAIVAYSLLLRERRELWRTRGPWLGLLVGTLVITPHLYGMWQIDFAPLKTAFLDHDAGFHSTVEVAPWWGRIVYPLDFLGFNALMLGGVLAMVVVLFLVPGEPIMELAPDRTRARAALRYYGFVTFAPVAASALLSAALNFHMNALWAMAWFPFVGLVGVLAVDRPIGASGYRTMWGVWCAFALGVLLFVGVKLSAGPYITGRVPNVKHDGERLSQIVGDRWAELTHRAPLKIVVGTHWTGGNVCVYHAEHPHLLLDGMPSRAPWLDTRRIAREGAALVWEGHGDPPWRDSFGIATPIERITVPLRTSAPIPPRLYSMAFILPQRE
jgi:4-amino-4-deoxy-L-arabinose transferase-like glycosyltransferase